MIPRRRYRPYRYHVAFQYSSPLGTHYGDTVIKSDCPMGDRVVSATRRFLAAEQRPPTRPEGFVLLSITPLEKPATLRPRRAIVT